MKVCIDPGHQEVPDFDKELISPDFRAMKLKCSPRTFGLRSRILEYEIVLQIDLTTEEELKKKGREVLLTRRSNKVNLSNIERAQIANFREVDLCIKIHSNGVRGSLRYIIFWKRGVMALIPSPNGIISRIYKPRKVVAQILHNRLLHLTKFPDLGIVPRNYLAGFSWLSVPVILLDLGYLTNPVDEAYPIDRSFQKKLAVTIAGGAIDAYKALEI